MTDTQQEAVDKACEELQELVVLAGEATGVFSDYADEQMTVHMSGRTCEYATREERADHRTDPVLHFVEEANYLRIRRTAWSQRRSIDGENIKTPAFTIEVQG